MQLIAAHVEGRPLPLDAPYEYLVALPMAVTFCLVLALRMTMSLPTDVQANWTFRLTAITARRSCLRAVRALSWIVAILPVGVVVFVAGGWLWGWQDAAGVAAMHAASGLVLCELALVDCEAIPFTRDRGLSSGVLRFGAPAGVVGLIVHAFLLDGLQVWALAHGHVLRYAMAAVSLSIVISLAAGAGGAPPIPASMPRTTG
ncbi:MAG: hypothetical protein R2712_23055 [Vicinamibacterales bacterium]